MRVYSLVYLCVFLAKFVKTNIFSFFDSRFVKTADIASSPSKPSLSAISKRKTLCTESTTWLLPLFSFSNVVSFLISLAFSWDLFLCSSMQTCASINTHIKFAWAQYQHARFAFVSWCYISKAESRQPLCAHSCAVQPKPFRVLLPLQNQRRHFNLIFSWNSKCANTYLHKRYGVAVHRPCNRANSHAHLKQMIFIRHIEKKLLNTHKLKRDQQLHYNWIILWHREENCVGSRWCIIC